MKQLKVNLDIYGITKSTGWEFVQGDENAYPCEFTILARSKPYDMSVGVWTATITWVRANKTTVLTGAEKIQLDGNVLKYTLESNVYAVAGALVASVELYKDGSRLTTCRFTANVREQLSDGAEIPSQNEYNILLDLLVQVTESASQIARAEALREQKELGRQDAELLRDEAEQSRDEAEQSRDEAETSRKSAYATHAGDEQLRREAELLRDEAEQLRDESEDDRESAESDRRLAENTREDEFDTALSDFNTNSNLAISEFIDETERVESTYPVRLTAVEDDFVSHKNDYATHLNDSMPHKIKDLELDKVYRFGFQLSGEGNPQIIFEEVI